MSTTATRAEEAPGTGAAARRRAVIHRMVMDKHVCPWGLRALHLLRSHGFAVEDHPLRTREEVDRFKAEHGVKTTPQIFVEGTRIGGHDDLRRYLGLKVRDPKALTYAPVAWLFAASLALALAASHSAFGSALTPRAAEWTVAFAMVLLALQKLRDVDSFATMFLGYDLLAQRWVPYGRIYPYAEALAGVLMVAGALNWLSVPIALFIGTIGAVSVFKAVYIDRRELKCACVGGDSNVPLGFVSLLENVMMVGMALWMAASHGWM
ncbi:MauE/DoxX family redox-associated membrane protein [Aureimonas sp. AU4]|uniref:MauE/DoxX family redox-associated membrane protein n=1 Tax=Aureimonas sp. AU4 TaxID=1638163 RepID=UPI000783ABBE|nr:MauE/DoxX family redox-associated membrane protein [Aureimonas sp. AU4]